MKTFYNIEKYIYYSNDELNYWHKIDRNEFEIIDKPSPIFYKGLGVDFLYGIIKEKNEINVYSITDTLLFFNELKNNNKIKELKFTKGIIQDYNLENYKYIDLEYNYKNNLITERLIINKGKTIRFTRKKGHNNGGLAVYLNYFILNSDEFLKNNKNFFANQFLENNEYLINTLFLKNVSIDSLSNEKNSKEITLLIDNFNKIGNYRSATEIINKKFKNRAILWKEDYKMSDFNFESINDYCNSIDSVDIVMINDHHLFESSRYCVALFLNALKSKGFKYFAAESYISKDNDLNFNISQDQIDGYYNRQPTYGLLTHFAYLNNYVLCGYDSSSDLCKNNDLSSQQCRDSTQANNIAKIYHYDKSAKIIVFGGHSHINKTKTNNFTPMGYYLQKILPEKNIIAINQVSLISNYGSENSLQNIITDSVQLKEPKLIRSKKNFNKVNDGTYDAYLVHPNSDVIDYWYYSANAVNVEKIKLTPPKEAFFVEVFAISESTKNICVFKSLVSDLHKNYIFLPKSNYKINYYNSHNDPI
ncbi:hypothetical protein ACFSX9_01225 [Flavobacterium ardleyense]|uniref:Uncharacterized protein n=1 Tax=Flavobacterium ardleyense TaxID=2038737 RepID=A0ABW5Z3Y2_9FLAO